MPSWLTFNAGTGEMTGTPMATGTYPVELSVSDGQTSTTQSFDIVVSAGGHSGYAAWAGMNGVVGSMLDDDGDGRVNLYEYALNGIPTNAGNAGVTPTFVSTGDAFQYRHLQRNDDANLTYAVERTTNLVSGDWGTDGITILGTNDIGGAYDEVSHEISAGSSSLYIRLNISSPE